MGCFRDLKAMKHKEWTQNVSPHGKWGQREPVNVKVLVFIKSLYLEVAEIFKSVIKSDLHFSKNYFGYRL